MNFTISSPCMNHANDVNRQIARRSVGLVLSAVVVAGLSLINVKVEAKLPAPTVTKSVTKSVAKTASSERTSNATAAERIYFHQVIKNDTFLKIAQTYLTDKTNIAVLQKYNPGVNPRAIPIASTVRIPIAAMRALPASATLLSVSGAAKVNGQAATPANIGQRINERDKLVTGDGGFITIKLADGSTLTVQSKSSVEIERARLLANTSVSESVVKLDAGRIETKVAKQHPQARYEVRTPTSNMGVRGTTFRAAAEPGDKTISEVIEGKVAIAGAKEALQGGVALNAGFGTFVLRDAPPAPPVALLPEPILADIAGTQTSADLVITFAGVAGAAAYRAQVATDSQFLQPVADTTSQTPNLRLVNLPDGALFVQVRAIDKDGLEGLSAVKPFSIAARPFAPEVIKPIAVTGVPSADVVFQWVIKPSLDQLNNAAMSNVATQYRLQVATDANFSNIVIDENNIRSPSYKPKKSLAGGIYFYRIASITENGREGPMGSVNMLTVSSAEAPSLRVARATDDPHLQWSIADATNATNAADAEIARQGKPAAEQGLQLQRYQLELSTRESFTSIVRSSVTSTNKFSLAGLEKNTYFARVRTVGAASTDGNIIAPGLWSDVIAVEIFNKLF